MSFRISTLISKVLRKSKNRENIFAFVVESLGIEKEVVFKILFKEHPSLALLYSYRNLGILNYKNPVVSGEDYFLRKVLPVLLKGAGSKILFDVGANVGEYTSQLYDCFNKSFIYSFEPVPSTFKRACLLHEKVPNVSFFNIGLSDEKKEIEISILPDNELTQHASFYPQVLTQLHKYPKIKNIVIQTDTLDNFCAINNIGRINFLKIDTEGHELSVLKGAKEMLSEGLIDIIQFEFNEMNIISRTFLKDFYDLLKGYRFYRLDSESLISLGDYNSNYEIFKFQNIVAVKNQLSIALDLNFVRNV